MRKTLLATAVLVFAGAVSAFASSGVMLTSTSKYENHSLGKGDTFAQQTFSMAAPIGTKASALGTVGVEYDFMDHKTNNTLLGAAVVYSFNKKSYFLASYSNFRVHGSAADFITADTSDNLYFMHSYAAIKKTDYNVYFRTAYTTDSAFDNNRLLSEQLFATIPVLNKFSLNLGAQMNYSLVLDEQSHNVYDIGLSMPYNRRGKFTLGYKRAEYKRSNLEDNVFSLSYNHRLL